jgi:hypothetical protein
VSRNEILEAIITQLSGTFDLNEARNPLLGKWILLLSISLGDPWDDIDIWNDDLLWNETIVGGFAIGFSQGFRIV